MIFLTFIRARYEAQEAQPDTYAGFEGREVSRIEISAGPGVNTDDFQPLIKQKQGTPFSAAAVRDSIAALQQTNQFSKVQVKVDARAGGSGCPVYFGTRALRGGDFISGRIRRIRLHAAFAER